MDLHHRFDTSAGKALPGDQAPLVIPYEHFSVTGLMAELGVITGGILLFP
jgi:hypothetical protein